MTVPNCERGHPQNAENVWQSPNGKQKRCRPCVRENKARSRSGRSYASHGGTLRRENEMFCPDCIAGVHSHSEIGCLRLVAPEPRDFPCKCGTRRPLWWVKAAGECDV